MKRCANCSFEMQDSASFCPRCGAFPAAAHVAAPAPAGPPPAASAIAHPATAPQAQPAESAPVRTSSLASASLVCGLLSILIFPLSVVAIALGIMAHRQIKISRESGDAMATAGIVLGSLVAAFFAILYSFFLLAFPDRIGFRNSNSYESTAIGSVRTISTAEVTYMASYPERGYSGSLLELGRCSNASNTASKSSACLIDRGLAGGLKDGYYFTYAPGLPNEQGIITSYTIRANPITPGRTGDRHFFSDETAVIRYSLSGPAGSQSPPLQ